MVRAIFNPNGVVTHRRPRATTPLGLAATTRFSQGSLADSATLGFGAESLWDSSLEFPKGNAASPDISHLTPRRSAAEPQPKS